MAYPPTASELRQELEPYPLHGDLTDTELAAALQDAQSELHTAIPAFAQANNSNYEQQAKRLCLALARWYVRMARERTPEGDVPPALLAERRILEQRIQQAQSSFSISARVERYEPLEPVPLPAPAQETEVW
jgi:hypothetical protein